MDICLSIPHSGEKFNSFYEELGKPAKKRADFGLDTISGPW
jgi:hypothetical protein